MEKLDASCSEQPHRVPGQYIYEGVLFCKQVRRSVLENRDSIECREDDVFVVTYPKSGTTWVMEMADMVLHPEQLGDDGIMKQEERIPFLEFHDDEHQKFDNIETMERMASPRLIKSHLQTHLFPSQAFEKKSKIIYVGRNPKDNAVSYYHFYQCVNCFGYYKGSWEDFLKMYLKDQLVWGGWASHCLGWWKHTCRNESNVLFLKYEDIKKGERETVLKIASFLGRELDNVTVDKIVNHCSFDNMKKNPAVNRENTSDVDSTVSPFMRKGAVGDWKNYFTAAQNEQIENYYREHLQNSGLDFEW